MWYREFLENREYFEYNSSLLGKVLDPHDEPLQ